jgi:hypothetical protein
MPLMGYVCPEGTPTNEHQRPGQRNYISYCLGDCPNPCVSPPLLAAMWQSEQWNYHKGAYLSSSMISNTSGCPRQTWYERQPDVEVFEHPRRRWWPFRGTFIHGLVESAEEVVAPYGWMQELKMSWGIEYPDEPHPEFDADGNFTGNFTDKPLVITLSGTTDAYNPVTKQLHDFKTLSDEKIADFLAGKEASKGGSTYHPQIKDAWVRQTNVYGLLVGKTRITPEWREALGKHGITLEGEYFPKPERLQMQMITMMEPILTASGRAYVKMRDTTEYHVSDVPLIDEAELEAFVREQAYKWYRWLVLGEQPPVVPKSKDWLCRNCAFNGHVFNGAPCRPREERLK